MLDTALIWHWLPHAQLLAPPLNRLICGCLLQLRPSQRLELSHPFGTLEVRTAFVGERSEFQPCGLWDAVCRTRKAATHGVTSHSVRKSRLLLFSVPRAKAKEKLPPSMAALAVIDREHPCFGPALLYLNTVRDLVTSEQVIACQQVWASLLDGTPCRADASKCGLMYTAAVPTCLLERAQAHPNTRLLSVVRALSAPGSESWSRSTTIRRWRCYVVEWCNAEQVRPQRRLRRL